MLDVFVVRVHEGNGNEIPELDAQQISHPAEIQQQKSLRFSSVIIFRYHKLITLIQYDTSSSCTHH